MVAAQAVRRLRRPIRFGLVGASGVVVNSVLLYLLAEAAGLHYLLAAGLATEAAIISNFTLNDRWTFADARTETTWLVRASRYNLVSLGGLLISVAILGALTEIAGLHYLIANFFAMGSAFLWNYAINSSITWSQRRNIEWSRVPDLAANATPPERTS